MKMSGHHQLYTRGEMIETGLRHTSKLTVTEAVTTIQVGSGDMPVLATPMMMALMETSRASTTTDGGEILKETCMLD